MLPGIRANEWYLLSNLLGETFANTDSLKVLYLISLYILACS